MQPNPHRPKRQSRRGLPPASGHSCGCSRARIAPACARLNVTTTARVGRTLLSDTKLQPQLVWVGHSCPTRSYNHSECGSDTPVRHDVTTTTSVGRTLLSDTK